MSTFKVTAPEVYVGCIERLVTGLQWEGFWLPLFKEFLAISTETSSCLSVYLLTVVSPPLSASLSTFSMGSIIPDLAGSTSVIKSPLTIHLSFAISKMRAPVSSLQRGIASGDGKHFMLSRDKGGYPPKGLQKCHPRRPFSTSRLLSGGFPSCWEAKAPWASAAKVAAAACLAIGRRGFSCIY